MQLTAEEKNILEGYQGETLQKVMRSIVLYGDTFDADRLMPLDGPVHLVTSFGTPILKPVFKMMDELIEAGLKTEEPFTVDPRPLDYNNFSVGLLNRLIFWLMYGKQENYEEQLKKVGLKDNNAFTCTCYLPRVGNRPQKGDILAWAESSAVVFANSVLGARTNRNSGVIELLSGIIAKTPEFGLLSDEGRKAGWLIEVKTDKLPNPQLLGSAVGLKVMEEVPYIIGLNDFFSEGLNREVEDYLKDMGAASAADGAVGLFHAEGITPEAVEYERELLKDNYQTYVIDDDELKDILASYPVMWKKKKAEPELCFIGCPHLSLEQIYKWTDIITASLKRENKNHLEVRTVLTAAPDIIKKFKEDSIAYNKLRNTGAVLASICPLMYMNNPLAARKPVITNSTKLRTYSTARYLKDEEIIQLIIKKRRLG